MQLDFSNASHSKKQRSMINFLMNDFCNDIYEREEMAKWIEHKGLEKVYQVVNELFKEKVKS